MIIRLCCDVMWRQDRHQMESDNYVRPTETMNEFAFTPLQHSTASARHSPNSKKYLRQFRLSEGLTSAFKRKGHDTHIIYESTNWASSQKPASHFIINSFNGWVNWQHDLPFLVLDFSWLQRRHLTRRKAFTATQHKALLPQCLTKYQNRDVYSVPSFLKAHQV